MLRSVEAAEGFPSGTFTRLGLLGVHGDVMEIVTATWKPDHAKAKLVGGWATPLKNMSSSVGMISNPILMGK